MAILQALLAALLRSAGKLLNTVFGWATVMVFGKVPADRQIYLSVMGLGSVAWIAAVAGIAFPSLGTFLLSFVTLPDWVDRTWVRLAMLTGAVVVPAVVGGVSLLLRDPADRPQGWRARGKAVLKGYPFTLGLAVTLILMTVLAPVVRLHTLARRWTTQHVPIVVDADDYEEVVREIGRTLDEAGWPTRREPASWMLRLPTRALTLLAGGYLSNLVAERLATLRGPRLEVILHPADLVISGREADVVDARAVLAEELAFSKAHLTWTKEANAIEDRLQKLWTAARGGKLNTEQAGHQLRVLENDLRRLDLSYEEWEILFRAKLLVRVAVGAACAPGEARNGGPGWAEQVALPLALAAAGVALESPRVRASLEDLVVRLLAKPARRAAQPITDTRRAA
jgi:hypothetical protein